MSKRIQLRRGTDTENNNFTGAVGEVTVDTTNKTLRVHDGATVGGHPLMREIFFGAGSARLNVTSSRTLSTTYTNTSATFKMVNIRVNLTPGSIATLLEGAIEIDSISTTNEFDQALTLTGIILPNRTYKCEVSGTGNIQLWVESI